MERATLANGRGRMLTRSTPRRSGLATDQHAHADAKRGRHFVAEFVEQLLAEAVPAAKLLDGEGVNVVRCIKQCNLADLTAHHAVSPKFTCTWGEFDPASDSRQSKGGHFTEGNRAEAAFSLRETRP